MSDYTVCHLEEAEDVMGGKYPGEMHFLTQPLGKIREVPAGTAVRVAPHVVRSVHNDREEEVELVIVSVRVEDLRAEGEIIEDFWPD